MISVIVLSFVLLFICSFSFMLPPIMFSLCTFYLSHFSHRLFLVSFISFLCKNFKSFHFLDNYHFYWTNYCLFIIHFRNFFYYHLKYHFQYLHSRFDFSIFNYLNFVFRCAYLVNYLVNQNHYFKGLFLDLIVFTLF